jgi:hypothetical protein
MMESGLRGVSLSTEPFLKLWERLVRTPRASYRLRGSKRQIPISGLHEWRNQQPENVLSAGLRKGARAEIELGDGPLVADRVEFAGLILSEGRDPFGRGADLADDL